MQAEQVNFLHFQQCHVQYSDVDTVKFTTVSLSQLILALSSYTPTPLHLHKTQCPIIE